MQSDGKKGDSDPNPWWLYECPGMGLIVGRLARVGGDSLPQRISGERPNLRHGRKAEWLHKSYYNYESAHCSLLSIHTPYNSALKSVSSYNMYELPVADQMDINVIAIRECMDSKL